MQVAGRVEALFGLLRSARTADLSYVIVFASSTLAAVTSLRLEYMASLGCRLRDASTMTTERGTGEPCGLLTKRLSATQRSIMMSPTMHILSM